MTLQTTNLSSWCPSPLPGAHPCPPAPGGQTPSTAALAVLCFPPGAAPKLVPWGSSHGYGVIFNPLPLRQEISWCHSARLSLGAPRDVGQGWGLRARCSSCGLGRAKERQRGGFCPPLLLHTSRWHLVPLPDVVQWAGRRRKARMGWDRQTNGHEAGSPGASAVFHRKPGRKSLLSLSTVSEIISSLAVLTAMSDLRSSVCLAY